MTTRRHLLTLAASGSLGLAGCLGAGGRGGFGRPRPDRTVDPDWRPGPGTWAARHYGPANRRYNPHASPPRSDPTVRWTYAFADSLGDGTMAVADDTAFVGTDGRLVAVDLADGTERWTRATDGIARLRVVDGRLYQTTPGLDESTVVARTFEGAERWRTTVPDHVQPLHERDGYVFLGGRDGYHVVHADRGEVVRSDDVQVRALAAADGALYGASFDVIVRYDVDGPRLATRWRVDSDASVELLAPVVGDAVYAPLWRPGGSDGRVRILADTGTERGRIDLPARPWGLTLTPRGPVVPTGTRLLAGRADGDDRWTVELNGRPRAVAAGDTVVAADPLLAVDDATGERLWALDVGLVRLLAVAGSTVYAATNDRLVAVRP